MQFILISVHGGKTFDGGAQRQKRELRITVNLYNLSDLSFYFLETHYQYSVTTTLGYKQI